MIRVLTWLKDYWYVPLLVVAGVVASVLWRRLFGGKGEDPMVRVGAELRAIDAGREVREVRLERGLAEAQAAVRARYADKLQRLNDAEVARVEKLRDDPDAMARAIERLTR